jgi:drug/metabolite transporter (DMT)-like permease
MLYANLMRILYALTAALARGLQYVLLEKLLVKVPSLIFFAISSTVGVILRWILLLTSKTSLSFKTYFKDSHTLRLFILVIILFIIGNAVIVFAIKDKNATVASLIEISYPLFVVLFGYLLYRSTHLNTGTIIGGLLVFAGIVMVYIFNK